jgi:hypothetical protein
MVVLGDPDNEIMGISISFVLQKEHTGRSNPGQVKSLPYRPNVQNTDVGGIICAEESVERTLKAHRRLPGGLVVQPFYHGDTARLLPCTTTSGCIQWAAQWWCKRLRRRGLRCRLETATLLVTLVLNRHCLLLY